MVNRTHAVVGGLLVAIILAVGIAAAFYTGAGPAPGGSDGGEELADFPTATAAAEGTTDGDTESTATPEPAPFSFTIDTIEECGQTCRDVTATLHNNQDTTATGVTVFIRMFAGQDNTDTDDLVWEGKEEIGTLEGGASHTTTERVELSLQEARKIDQEDGWITLLTTVKTDDTTVTFKESEQVA